MQFQAYELPEQLFPIVVENGFGAELPSESGVISGWSEDLHPHIVCVFNMLDFIICGSKGIGQEVTKQGFLDSCSKS